jgi:hypothetical protein
MISQINYLIFCMEQYKLHKHMSGKEIAELFKKYNVFKYILSYFDALHTAITEYIIKDLIVYKSQSGFNGILKWHV